MLGEVTCILVPFKLMLGEVMNPASIQAYAKGVELYPTPIQPIVQRLNFPS